MDGPESRARSMDTDEGTFETLETASSSPRRPLSIVQETYVDERVTVIDGKGIPSKPPSTMPLEAEQPPPSAQASDATSTRSLPALEISRSQTPVGSVESSAATSAVAPPSPARSRHSTNDENPSSRDAPRTINRRSTIDVRNNRLSGFFNNFVNRRGSQIAAAPSPTTRTTPGASSPTPRTKPPPRTPSPVPPPRPSTPPPLLPAPTLSDLGLSLSTITAKLAPSHFSSPPTSGAFLAPHYLLLCHAQGLDVLPLTYPPVPQPYALVRRVSFKSVVVMEHRGVLVAIAGRRDGVRVYALEEVKKAVEWRIDVEIKREKEKTRREQAKKGPVARYDRLQNNLENAGVLAASSGRTSKSSVATAPLSRIDSSRRKSKTPPQSRQVSRTEVPTSEPPPAYSALNSPRVESRASTLTISRGTRGRAASVSEVLAAPVMEVPPVPSLPRSDSDTKGDWVERSIALDADAIDIVAAGASGSQALDERTSAAASRSVADATAPVATDNSPSTPLAAARTSTTIRRTGRPADLDLTDAMPSSSEAIPAPQPSPVPTLMTLRQTLATSMSSHSHVPTMRSLSGITSQEYQVPDTPNDDEEEEDDASQGPVREQVSFAQMLMESRLPELPPPGTRRPQQPLLLTSSHSVASPDDEPSSPRASESPSVRSRRSVPDTPRRRRRWSVLGGIFPGENQAEPVASPPVPAPAPAAQPPPVTRRPSGSNLFRRSSTTRGDQPSNPLRARASASVEALGQERNSDAASGANTPGRPSRLFSRIFDSALHPRRSEERQQPLAPRHSEAISPVPGHNAPAPKLEYVKLPGTKGALMIKSVETAKKSFLAILCGDAGEKVELFAGTYRTALGLSRTFILPDSPRSLELQLQGDDLVEVFLVFSQNVFGLEPATVRVREVRIGRSERRAARRRARNARGDETPGEAANGEETNVTVTVGVVADSAVTANEDGVSAPLDTATEASAHTVSASLGDGTTTPQEGEVPTNASSQDVTQPDETNAAATLKMGPFTTFQQLAFAPKFPLASIANEYIIPPTYASFLDYRNEHEAEPSGQDPADLASLQFTPPGLPLLSPLPPSRWFYRDPKGVVHGPWKASLMQSWYKEGLLPPDLPVRREEETVYILLKDLRAQSVDPTHPFKPVPPPLSDIAEVPKPLLAPLSLLSQPRHFGPPALFFSSRGGHSTTIVDARGRSVIKGRFVWTVDDAQGDASSKLGDVRHLEAFDVKDGSVLVALRHGGLEAVDLADALLQPGDDSRSILPHFHPSEEQVARRHPFIWKVGTPTGFQHGSAAAIASLHQAGGSGHRGPSRKASLPTAKSPGRAEFLLSAGGNDEQERTSHDEVFFLGRKDDEVYFCERSGNSFRILRICPDDLA